MNKMIRSHISRENLMFISNIKEEYNFCYYFFFYKTIHGRGGERRGQEGERGAGTVSVSPKPGLRGPGRKDSRAHGQPWLHGKLEAKLVYKRPCLNKSKTNKQINKGK